MKVLITGGAGFIGSHLVEYHLAKGDTVFAIDDLETGSHDNIAEFMKDKNFQFEETDILTWSGLKDAAQWADRVYHMAAIVGRFHILADPVKVLAINIAACERLLRAIHLNERKPVTVIASSSEVYGFNPDPVLQENDDFIFKSTAYLRWGYAISKVADEAYAMAYINKFKDNIIVARLFNTIGPRQTGKYGMVVPRFVDQAVHNKPITIFGDGKQKRSFCDVRDLTVMLDLLADTPSAVGEIFNVGNDKDITIEELAHLVRKLANSQSDFQYLSYQEGYGFDFGDIDHRKPNLEKLNQFISFKPRWSLTDTLKDLIQRKKDS